MLDFLTLAGDIASCDLVDNIHSLNESDVLLFCHDADRPLSLRDRAFSPLIDSVRDDLQARGLTCCSIALPWSSLTKNKAHGDPASFNLAYLRFRFLSKIGKCLYKFRIDRENPYRKIFKITKAKLVITIGTPKDLAVAARHNQVFHVELLHGIGYTTIEWGWGELAKEYLPQGILSLDLISTETFSALSSKNINIFTIPHPFLRRFLPNRIHMQPLEWNPGVKHEKKVVKRILVSLNWGYSGDHGHYVQFANIIPNGLFFDEIGELIHDNLDIFWHFRLHPVQLVNKRYKSLLAFMDHFIAAHPNTEWREASRVPFPCIAMHCDGNIGMSSMSCYDAAAMGVPSLMLCPTIQKGGIHQDWFSDLEDEGYVTKTFVNKDRLRSWIYQVCKTNPRLSNLDDDIAWDDAVKWMLQNCGLDQRIKPKSQE